MAKKSNDDKKEYRDILRVTDTVVTVQTAIAAFAKTLAETEDPQLKAVVKTGHDEILRMAAFADLKKKADMRQIPVIKPITMYCKQVLENGQPVWQQIALSQGWTPPAESNP